MSKILSKAVIATVVLSVAIAVPVFAKQPAAPVESSPPAAKTDQVYIAPKAVPPVDAQAPAIAPSATVTLTILHTNDIHGRFPTEYYYGTPEGMTFLATHIANERAKNPNTILLDAGDTFQGNAFAQYFRNATPNPIAGAMNMLDYDAFVIGNHEYNFGPATFATMLGQLNFPILGSANVTDTGAYGFINDNVEDYITMTVGGLKVAIFGLTNPEVPLYELPSNIEGLSFLAATPTAKSLVPQIRAAEDPDLLIALTHIGYDVYKGSYDKDKALAEQVPGIDVIVGGHSHDWLNPARMITSTINPTGTLVAQTGAYAANLGKIDVVFTGNITDGYDITLRQGVLLAAGDVATDTAMVDYLEPFVITLTNYTQQEIGYTAAPIDGAQAYTEETSSANLQADSAVYGLTQGGVDVDFHLSGAMANRSVAAGATATDPYTLTVDDMYTLMPYENSLLAMRMNGPQIKDVLERGYRNYYYYKFVPGYGGYSHYTTCMLDINKGGQITYRSTVPDGDNVLSLVVNGQSIDFMDATTYYTVSTVNYLAAGSCNFNDDGVTLWPLNQIVTDTQLYVRDSVIDYVEAMGTITPAVEGRLVFQEPNLSTSEKSVEDPDGDGVAEAGEILIYTIAITNTGTYGAGFILTDTLPAGVTYVANSLSLDSAPTDFTATVTSGVLMAHTAGYLNPPMGGSLYMPNAMRITFAAQVSDPLPTGDTIINMAELVDQVTTYELSAAIALPEKIFLPLVLKDAVGTAVTP